MKWPLKSWRLSQLPGHYPYKAMQYTLNQWELLTGYLADGRLHISNALAENAIRPFAVG
ncbi:IS66 family transposase, partial [Thiolapillus sp.]